MYYYCLSDLSKDRVAPKGKVCTRVPPKHTIQKQTNRLRVQGQNKYTEQLQKQYIPIIQVQKHNDKMIIII